MRRHDTACRIAVLALVAVVASAGRAEAQFNPFSGIVGVIEAAAEDRSAADIATDLKLKTAIVAGLTDKLGKEGALIGVDVYEQDVMLTGSVSSASIKTQAEAVARAASGIKKTYNELLLDGDAAKEGKKGAAEGFIDDTVIEKKINALFLEDKTINVTNFRWRSVRGHVFLFGRALSSAENARATEVARSIANVVSVVNRTKVKPKPKT